MRFVQLEVGSRFLFPHDYDPDETWAYEWDWRIKTGARTYERVWSDGSRSEGRVGVGDNPVKEVSHE